jgi:O-antigen ligase
LKQDQLWAYSIAGLLAVQLVIGPVAAWWPGAEYLSAAAGGAIILAALWRLRNGLPSRSALWASIILVSAISLLALQIVPLPASLWSNLPGREFVVSTLSAIDQKPGWMTLSLAPSETVNYLIYSLPAIGAFFACLSLEAKSRKTIFVACVSLAVLSSLIGLAQNAGAASHVLQFYDEPGMGFFANRNFQGALLYCSIPAMAALSFGEFSKKSIHPIVISLFSIAFLAIALIGIGSTASRSATLLAMIGVVLTALMVWRRQQQFDKKPRFGLKLIAFAVIMFAVAQFGLAGLARLAQTDPLSESRSTISVISIQALKDFFPVGSGFGSFVPVYAMREQPDNMLGGFVNHAHNDWVELVIEGGLPMAVIMAAFVMWLGFACFKAWQNRASEFEDFSLRAAAIIIGLLLIHSLSDYPLRSRALMALFAICCGILAYGPEAKLKRSTRRPAPVESRKEPAPESPNRPRQTGGPYFVRKPSPTDTGEP